MILCSPFKIPHIRPLRYRPICYNICARQKQSGIGLGVMLKKRGNCYVTAEALFYLLGGKELGWKPMTVRHEGDVHWFLKYDGFHTLPYQFRQGTILDLTASQFKTPVPYENARGRGFLTSKPSKRARKLMKTLVWQE